MVLDSLMAQEPEGYLHYLTAFRSPRSLTWQSSRAKKDRYAGIWQGTELAGFYCLRGLDEGYQRPSFGIYVRSSCAGRGLARQALEDAYDWCRRNGYTRLMLKVYPENTAAYRVYSGQGFVEIGKSPDSQLIMEKVLV